MLYCILSLCSQLIKFAFYKKRYIRYVTKSAYTAHTEPLHKENNILKVQDLSQLAILKFYCKLVNNNLPPYSTAITPQFSVSHIKYNLRNSMRQLPIIRHEFHRQKNNFVFLDLVLWYIHNIMYN